MKNITKLTWFFILITALFINSCSAKPEQEYITIGALLPLTGDSSDEGIRTLNGMQLAKQKINESGGILGKKLDIIVLNDRGDEEYIVKQYNVLKERGVAAIIGSSYSYVTIALAKISEKDGIPVISPTASNPDVTIGRPNVFRAIFIDDYQAEAMAHFAYNTLNARNALVLKNRNFSGYMRAADVFNEFFSEYGGETTVEYFSSEDEFPGILENYTNNKPDVIFCPEDYVPGAILINIVYEAGFNNTYVLGTDAYDGILAYVFNPEAMKNVYYSTPFSYDDQDMEIRRFVINYLDNFSQMPMTGAATAYTCVYILAEAIKTAGSTDKNAIISAIKENELDTILGNIKFDENNNPQTNVYVIQIESGIYSTFMKFRL